jgi:hypothetical protein
MDSRMTAAACHLTNARWRIILSYFSHSNLEVAINIDGSPDEAEIESAQYSHVLEIRILDEFDNDLR